MFDPIINKLSNQITREGITNETVHMILSLFDTLLGIDKFEDISVTNIQTLLLILEDHDLPPVTKRLVNELRCKIIRYSLGVNWQHGIDVANYDMTEMNRSLMTKQETITVYEDGTITRKPNINVQPLTDKDFWLLNDFGQAALNN